MQTIVILHTDFRIYWPARINKFRKVIKEHNYDLKVLEISGHGGNYNFDNTKVSDAFWECLFPDKRMEELNPKIISEVIMKRLSGIKPDILISGALAFPSGAFAVRYANKKGIPLILFDDAKLEDVKRNAFVNWIKKQLYSGVDAIFCPSPEWDETFNFFDFNKGQIFYGVNVVDNDFFRSRQKITRSDFPELSEGYFLNIGRQIEKKNIITLLKAYEIIQNNNDEIADLVLVGEGESRNELESFVKTHQIKNIHFLSFQSQEKLIQLYQNAALFILPSSYAETWGLVVNEAMASGLPVAVSKNVGCATTLVTEQKNGFTFDPYDPQELAEKLISFHFLSTKVKEKMAKCSQREIENWGLDRFSEGLISAIKSVQKKPKRRMSFFGKLITKYWNGRYRPV